MDVLNAFLQFQIPVPFGLSQLQYTVGIVLGIVGIAVGLYVGFHVEEQPGCGTVIIAIFSAILFHIFGLWTLILAFVITVSVVGYEKIHHRKWVKFE